MSRQWFEDTKVKLWKAQPDVYSIVVILICGAVDAALFYTGAAVVALVSMIVNQL